MSSQDHRNHKTPSLTPKLHAIESNWEVKVASAENAESDPMLSRSKGSQDSPLLHFKLKTPMIARADAIFDGLELDSPPAEIYGMIARCVHRVGGALVATVEDLATVALRDIPIRIAPIYSNAMPNVESLLSADAIELQLGDWKHDSSKAGSIASLHSLRIDWPLDVPDLKRLAKKIELIRCLTQNAVPVGIAVPVGDASETGIRSFQWLSEIGADFVTIRSAIACLGKHHPARNYFSSDPVELTRCIKDLIAGPGTNPIAIVIDHPWQDGYQAAQTILAGASFVSIDGYLARFVPALSELMALDDSDSLSSGVYRRSTVRPVPSHSISQVFEKLDLNSVLSKFVDQFRSSLEFSL